MAPSGVRTILVRFQGDQKGLNDAATAAEKKLAKGKESFGQINKAAVGASAVVVGGFALWAKGAIGAAEESVAATAALENVFSQMGGAASEAFLTAADAATRIGKAIAVDDDEVTAIQTKLATFGKIWDDPVKGAANFERATTLAFDLAAAGFGSADSNAAQLGKALQDPTKGMTALARSGVTFTDAEKKKIKQLQESGDLLGAQELVYAALEKQVGGTAASTVTGSQRMKVQLAELSETFGKLLLPAVAAVGGWVQKFTEFAERNKTVVAVLAGVLVGLAAGILLVNAAVKVWRATVLVATAAQWLWNIAVTANPIGLIILAIVALIAIIILVVKNWDTVKKAFFAAWNFIWNFLKGYIAWLKNIFWDNGIKKYFQLVGAIIGWLRDRWVAGFNKAKEIGASLVNFVKGIPGKIKSGFAKVGEFLSAPFRAGFQAARDAWNNTIGGKGFDIPSWVPFGMGGKSFRFPRFHQGGVVPGPLGREVPILARAGERVLTREQDQAAGGEFTGTLVLDSGQFLGMVHGQISRSNRELKRRTLTGAGVGR